VPLPFVERPDLHYRSAPCVFFDCDGVIFDSNGMKLEALRYALSSYPRAALARMELFWAENGGMSRYKKLEYFFRELVPTSDVAESVRAAAARFGEFSSRSYDAIEALPEALALVRDAGKSRSYAVSGTDEAELQTAFARKNLTALFAEVRGSPTTKLDHVRRILAGRAAPPGTALFIGDGGGDYDVCRTLGVPFIYLNQYSEWTGAAEALAEAPATLRAETWSELLALLGVER
jgi:phosphoglycolate phosphatase-like HAD superfamily hydrolase